MEIRGRSDGDQREIRGRSEGDQREIRGRSEGDQREIRGRSEGDQRELGSEGDQEGIRGRSEGDQEEIKGDQTDTKSLAEMAVINAQKLLEPLQYLILCSFLSSRAFQTKAFAKMISIWSYDIYHKMMVI